MSEQAIRTFIAITLSPEIQTLIENIQKDLKGAGADVKWVKPQNAHLTLKFLGKVPIEKLVDIKNTFKMTIKKFSTFSLRTDSIGNFPLKGNPRIIWLGLKSNKDIAQALVSSIEQALEALNFEKEKRRFLAHATLGRVTSTRNIMKLKNAIKNYRTARQLNQKIKTITLYQSQLTPSGPIYTNLKDFPLSAQ